jgi:hypothetical protein
MDFETVTTNRSAREGGTGCTSGHEWHDSSARQRPDNSAFRVSRTRCQRKVRIDLGSADRGGDCVYLVLIEAQDSGCKLSLRCAGVAASRCSAATASVRSMTPRSIVDLIDSVPIARTWVGDSFPAPRWSAPWVSAAFDEHLQRTFAGLARQTPGSGDGDWTSAWRLRLGSARRRWPTCSPPLRHRQLRAPGVRRA